MKYSLYLKLFTIELAFTEWLYQHSSIYKWYCLRKADG
jgi:hypothetical protein